MKIAVCQMRSTPDPWENLLHVHDRVNEATDAGAKAIFFPENVFYRGPRVAPNFSREDIHLSLCDRGYLEAKNSFARELKKFSESWKISVSLGSVFEKSIDPLPFNSHLWIQPGGLTTSYRKIHLFDFQSPTGAAYRESHDVGFGRGPVSVPFGPHALGLSICYDLRFPELYRALSLRKGCRILAVPAAFTQETGIHHWHVLLRARAIENLCFVLAAAQWGTHVNSQGLELQCFGHSVILDPWGHVVCEAPPSGDYLLIANLDFSQQDDLRGRLPALQGARLFQSTESDSSQE